MQQRFYSSWPENNTLIYDMFMDKLIFTRTRCKQSLSFRGLQKMYPSNSLRNLALEEVHTEYVFLTDIDFLPCKHLYNASLALLRDGQASHKKVISSVCFQWTPDTWHLAAFKGAYDIKKAALVFVGWNGSGNHYCQDSKLASSFSTFIVLFSFVV